MKVRALACAWNWKAALLSSVCRALIFFATNAPAGVVSGLRAMLLELGFRAGASGVLGSLTQTFSRASPQARWGVLVLLPALGHAAEYVVHSAAGTPRLGSSIGASVAFSVVTTAFNLYAMRRGALIVGAEARPLEADLRQMPALLAGFGRAVFRAIARGLRRVHGRGGQCPSQLSM